MYNISALNRSEQIIKSTIPASACSEANSLEQVFALSGEDFKKFLKNLKARRKFLHHLGRLNVLRYLIENGTFSLNRSTLLTLDTSKYLTASEAGKYLKRIFVYLKRRYGLKYYFTASEFQERGALHYHIVLLNVPFIPREEIAKRWIGGLKGVYMQELHEPIDAVFYVLSYLKKGLRVSWSYSFKEYLAFTKVYYRVRYDKASDKTYIYTPSFSVPEFPATPDYKSPAVKALEQLRFFNYLKRLRGLRWFEVQYEGSKYSKARELSLPRSRVVMAYFLIEMCELQGMKLFFQAR